MLGSTVLRIRYVISGTAWVLFMMLDYQRIYGDRSVLALDEHTFIGWARIAFILNIFNSFNQLVYYTWKFFNWMGEKGVCCQRSCTGYRLKREMTRMHNATIAFAIQLYVVLFIQYFMDIVATYIRNGGTFGNTGILALQMVLVLVLAAFHFLTFGETLVPPRID